jgi:hypothetical protein
MNKVPLAYRVPYLKAWKKVGKLARKRKKN